MTGLSKKKSKIKFIIIITASVSVIFFILVGTLLIDMLLIKTENAPVFSNIATTKLNDGEVTVGKGILYKTVVHRIDVSNGYLAGYAIFFPWDDGYGSLEDSPPVISMNFHGSIDNDSAYSENYNGETDDGDDIEFEDTDTLNMNLIQRLADREFDPFEFMEKFSGTIFEEDNSTKYFLRLMNNYALQIEYSGDKVIEMCLIDEIYNQYIDIEKQMIDHFLTLRDEE